MENKKKRGLFNNIRYLIEAAWVGDKRIFLYLGIFTITSAILPFITIFTPKLLLDEIMGKQSIETLAIILVSLFLISSLVNYLGYNSSMRSKVSILKIRMELMAKLSEKVMIMDFKNIEDKDMLNKIKAAETSLDGGYRGADAVYDKLFSILGAILGFAGYTTIVFTLSPWVLLYLLINVAIIYTLNMQTKKFEYSIKEERAELYRKSDYVYKTMSDFSYGKDIRVYNLNRWLVDKFKEFINGKNTLLKRINFKKFKVSAIDILLLMIREGIIYAYLIYRVIVVKDMEIGNFVMYFATVAGFATWLQTLITDISFIKSQDMYIDDLRELMEIGENENLQKDYRNIPKDAPYEIEFRNASFKYPHSERYI